MAEVVTGEAVVLEVPCARFPSRILALAIDLAIQLTVVVILLTVVGLSTADRAMDKAAVQAIVITVIVLTVVGYPIIWETATRGRSPGKFALGLRVVSDDGGPERFRQALVRGLATIVDFCCCRSSGSPPSSPRCCRTRESASATSSRAPSSSSSGCPAGGGWRQRRPRCRRSLPPGRLAWNCPA